MGQCQCCSDKKLSNDEAQPINRSENLERKKDSDLVNLPFNDSIKWPIIYNSLSQLYTDLKRKDLRNASYIEEAIKRYNPELEETSFDNLNDYIIELNELERQSFKELILNLIDYILRLPDLIKAPIKKLKQGEQNSINLTQEQCCYLLAGAFFCIYPSTDDRLLSNFNFNRLYEPHKSNSTKIEKLKCIMNYFKRTSQKMPRGMITFMRKCYNQNGAKVLQESNKEILSPIIFLDGRIEDSINEVEVDFANKYVGGGVLGAGCVQEEIRFVLSPELIVSKLFCEFLMDNEALLVKGTERFNSYKGYSKTFKWTGDYFNEPNRDEQNRLNTYLVAIDAIHFSRKEEQFMEDNIIRDINKCFAGFFDPNDKKAFEMINISNLPIATGHWGCGAFNGDKEIKFLIQLLVSSQEGKQMSYYTFDDSFSEELFKNINSFIQENNLRVSYVYKNLIKYCKTKTVKNSQKTFYDFLNEQK